MPARPLHPPALAQLRSCGLWSCVRGPLDVQLVVTVLGRSGVRVNGVEVQGSCRMGPSDTLTVAHIPVAVEASAATVPPPRAGRLSAQVRALTHTHILSPLNRTT
jgi:hypothetical protein